LGLIAPLSKPHGRAQYPILPLLIGGRTPQLKLFVCKGTTYGKDFPELGDFSTNGILRAY
jgi:hypothetical protein